MRRFVRPGIDRDSGSTVMRIFFVLSILGCVAGCSSADGVSSKTEGLDDLQPVSGSVSFEGKPTPGATVLFFPIDNAKVKGLRISGEVDEEGAFEMMTGVAKGALPGVKPGKYFVTVTWTKPEDPSNKDTDMIDLIPAKYGDYLTSPIRVEIQEGENVLDPFVLESSAADSSK